MSAFDDDEDNFFSELDLEEIMALEESHLESSDKENVGAPVPGPVQLKRRDPPPPVTDGGASIAGGGGDYGKAETFQSTPLGSQKKRFKFFKSAPTPIRLQPPSPVPDVSVIEFEDDEVQIIEERKGNQIPRNNGKDSVNSVTLPKKIHFEPRVEKDKLDLERKKGNQHVMGNTSKTTVNAIHHPPKKFQLEVEKGAHHVIVNGNAAKVNANPPPKKFQLEVGKRVHHVMGNPNKAKAPPPKIKQFELKIDNEEDKEWKRFVREFEAQSRFNTAWFKSIPITTLNISRCSSIVTNAREASHLVQFAKILFSFLKELIGGPGEQDRFSGDTDEPQLDKGYYNDLINLLELALVRLDRLMTDNDNTTGVINSDGVSQLKASIVPLMKDVLEQYVLGTIDFGKSRIPELLAKFHPKGLTELLENVGKTGDVDFLLPFCSRSKENLMTILEYFHSSNSSGFDEDPDFQVQPNHSSTKHFLPPSKLVAGLMNSLCSTNAVNVLPYQFQALVSFEYAISSSQYPAIFSHRKIIMELFSILNDVIFQCSEDGVDEKLMQFVFSALCHTSKLLNDRTLAKQVKFKDSPYLWKFLRGRR